MKFGPDIAVDGRKPAWLTDDTTPLQWINGYGPNSKNWDIPPHYVQAGELQFGPFIKAIRLPTDHTAYKALAAGFTPWLGGDKPPYDYSNGRVLCRNGVIISTKGVGRWSHRYGEPSDIIGYESSKSMVSLLRYTKPHTVASKLFADILQRLGRPTIEPVDTFEGVMQQLDNLTSVLVDREQMQRTFIAVLREEDAHALADKLEVAWNLIDPLLIQARKLVEQHDDPVQAVYAALKGGEV